MTTESQRPSDYSQLSPLELDIELRQTYQLVPPILAYEDTNLPPIEEDIDLVNNLINSQDDGMASMVADWKAGSGQDFLNYAAYRIIAGLARRHTGKLTPALSKKFADLLPFSALSQPVQELLTENFTMSLELGTNYRYDPIYGLLFSGSNDGGIFNPGNAKNNERRLINHYRKLNNVAKKLIEGFTDEEGNPRRTNYEDRISRATGKFVEKYGEQP